MKHGTNISIRWLCVGISALVLSGCQFLNKDVGFIDDQARLLTTMEAQHINQLLAPLLKQLDIHIHVVVLKDRPADINSYATAFFEKLTLGAKTQGAKGLLFLVDPAGKQVRLEVGYDLESIFPDAFLAYIMQKQMTPFFQANKVGPGIQATVELLVDRALGKIDAAEYSIESGPDTQETNYSGGGGTRTTVDIGSGSPEKSASSFAEQFAPQPSPLQALKTYQTILQLHIKDPNLQIYTPGTRKFFSNWVVTDAQQDNSLKSLQQVFSQSEVYQHEHLAVIRYPISNRRANPYFLRAGDDGWMLDFASMNKIVGFNHLNQWFFRTTDHEFMFAFHDVIFDENGFPHQKD